MIIKAEIPAKPLDIHPDGTAEVFSFCDFVEASEKWLWCGLCKNDYVYRVPDTMGSAQIRCNKCQKIGHVVAPPDSSIW